MTRPRWMDVVLAAACGVLVISLGEYTCVALGWSTPTWQPAILPAALALIVATAPGRKS